MPERILQSVTLFEGRELGHLLAKLFAPHATMVTDNAACIEF